MSAEIPRRGKFTEDVKISLERGVANLSRVGGSPELPLAKALLASHSNVDWERVNPKESGGILGSTAAAMHYAHIKTGKGEEYLNFFGESDPKKWEGVIATVLEDKAMSPIFYKNVGRPLTTVFPARRVPVEHVLDSAFGESPIRGVDLGAGAHVTLPFLGSDQYLDTDGGEGYRQKRAELIEQLGDPSRLNIQLGVGVDIQDGRKDPDWLRASALPTAANKPIVEALGPLLADASRDGEKFPFRSADLRDTENSLTVIQAITGANGKDPQVDFVSSSFVRHQLGRDKATQEKFTDLVNRLLAEGGVWIDMGEELLTQGDWTKSKVRVYKKEDDKLTSKGVPFVLRDFRYVEEVRLEYFS